MNLRSLTTTLSLAAVFSLSSPPAIAAPTATPERTVPIVYTSMMDGIHSQFGTLNELNPLFDRRNRDEIKTDGFHLSFDTLHLGRWYLFSPDQALSPQQAKERFASGLKIKASDVPIQALVSDYATVFQQPDANPAWLVPYLFEKLQANGDMPDISTTTAKLFDIEGGSGIRLQLYSQDGSLPTAEDLRHAQRWQWTIGGYLLVKRGRHETVARTFGRSFGSSYALALAKQWQVRKQAIRVDAGNLMTVPLNDPLGELALSDTFKALPDMALDALVPFRNELNLPAAMQVELARTVPLVAANLKGPATVQLHPYVIRECQGLRVAIIGLTDIERLTRAGLLGGKTGWSGSDPVKALAWCLSELEHERVDATVLVTNLKEERLTALREKAFGVAAIISASEARRASFHERLVPANSERDRDPRPWLMTGATSPQAGLLTLGFKPQLPRKGVQRYAVSWLENEIQYGTDAIPDPHPERSFAFRSNVNEFIASRSTAILPDMRVLAPMDKRLSDKQGDPYMQYRAPQWSAMTASCLRQSCEAEVAIISPLPGGDHTTGEIPRYFVDTWVPGDERVAITTLTGAKLKRLLALDPDHDRFVLAGCNPEKNLIGGRPIGDGEVYRIATTASLANNEAYAEIFQVEATTALQMKGQSIQSADANQSVLLHKVVLAKFDAMKSRNDGFSGSYFDELLDLLFDDGTETTPRWTLSLKPFQGSYQQFRVSNRGPFGEVRNSQINTPDNTAWGGKGNLSLTYEAADIDWENKVLAEYQQAQFETSGGQSFTQKLNDNLQLSSEFRLKFIKLQTQNTALEMVPFVSANYQSEFSPTTDQKTGQANPRRQELSGIAGAVLYPGTWLKEIRLGAIAKDDLAVGSGRIQPGVQFAGTIAQPLGPLNFSLDADLKNYFLTPEDTPSDLGLIGQVGAGLNFPLWGGFSLRVGVDSLLFSGKVASNRSLGSSVTPSIGLTYNTTWKPMQGLVY